MTTMISYKVLMTLTVIFIISSKAGKVEDDEKVKNCINYLSELGFSSGYGFLNFCIVHQYSDITQFRKSLETHRVAFVNFTPGSRDMTVKEEIITKFIEDNFKINSEHNIPTPIEFCREHNYVGCGFAGCLSNMLRSRAKIEAKKTEQYRKCEEEITKEYEKITTIIPATNENGVERPQRQESVYQNFSTENRCENVVVLYNLMVHKYSEDTIKAIDETVQLWPEWKRGYLNQLLEDFDIQNQSKKYLSKQKWCMQYYKQEPIQGSTSGTNPPSEK